MGIGIVRHKAEFKASPQEAVTSYDYTVEIYDRDYLLTATTFKCDSKGFTIRYNGSGSEIYAPINASKFSVNLYIEDASQETYISNIMKSEEGRYFIKVLRGSSMIWGGVVVTDGIKIEDISYPYKVTLTASDGLGLLKDIDYNDDGSGYEGKATIIEHIYNCLEKIGINEFWDTNDTYFQSDVNWFEDNMTYSASAEPLSLTRCRHSIWYEVDEKGYKDYKSCYDVLSQCLQLFGAQIKQSEGQWVVSHILEHDSATFNYRNYRKNGYIINSTTGNNDLPTSDSLVRLSGGIYDYVKPVGSIHLEYHHKSAHNYLAESVWGYGEPNTLSPLGTFTNTDLNMRILIRGTLRAASFQTTFVKHRHIFRITIKYGGYYYVKDDAWGGGQLPITEGWTTSGGYYYINGSKLLSNNNGKDDTYIINILTDKPPNTGPIELYFRIEYSHTVDMGGNTITVPNTWSFENGWCEVIDGELVAQNNTKFWKAEANNDNSRKLKYETLLGDGPFLNSLGALETWNGTGWYDSNKWAVGSATPTKKIQRLFIESMLAFRQYPIERYSGIFTGELSASNRIVFDSKKYYFLRGTYSANREDWQGEWCVISKDTTGLSTTDTAVGVAFINPPSVAGGGGGQPPGGATTDPVAVDSLPRILDPFTITTINNPISAGVVTSIDINVIGRAAIVVGDTIRVFDAITQFYEDLTVTADVGATDTTISVSGTLTNSYNSGSGIIVQPSANTPASEEFTIEIKTSSGTLTNKDVYLLNTNAGAYILATSGTVNKKQRLKNIHASDCTVTVAGGESLDNGTTITLAQFETVEVIDANSNWYILSEFKKGLIGL